VQSFTSQANRNVDVNFDAEVIVAAAAAAAPATSDLAKFGLGQLDWLKTIVFHVTLLFFVRWFMRCSFGAIGPNYQLALRLVPKPTIWMHDRVTLFAAKQRAAVVVRPVANRAEPLRDWKFSNNIAVLTMGPIA
jgi:hypothetical protein